MFRRGKKSNQKKSKKDKYIHGIVLEDGVRTDYDLGPDKDHLKAGIKHGNITLMPERVGVFTQKNWRGKPKLQAIFFDLIKPLAVGVTEIRPMRLEPFNPVTMWSAEKADLMIHETLTAKGVSELIPKLPGQGGFGGNKKLMFIIMFIAVVAILLAKLVFKVF